MRTRASIVRRPIGRCDSPGTSPIELRNTDLFGGSGSTLIAVEQTGRKAFLMELDPLYCDVIVQRFEKFSGKKAERVCDEVAVQ